MKSVSLGEFNLFGQRKQTPEEEALEAKREYNQTLREQRYNKRQKEVSGLRRERKRQDEEKRVKQQQGEVTKTQTNLSAGIAKKQHNMEDEYRERNRDACIARREEKWQGKMQEYISTLLDEAQDAIEEENERKKQAKTSKLLHLKGQAKQRAEVKHNNEGLDEVRNEIIRTREATRYAAELVRIDDLKQELEEELEYKIECIEQGVQSKVTMNDLVKSLVPVPAISELFCAVKSELDEIKYLKGADLESLAKLLGLPPLLYVKQLNEEHEKNKLAIPSAVPIAHSV